MRQAKKDIVSTQLGNSNIGKLLLSYSIPAIVGMTASSIYNIIDRIFIGQSVGPMAIAGLAITFPIMNLSAAIGSLVGAGSSTMISIRLGEKKSASAMRFLGNALVINIILGILFAILGLLFLDPLLIAFGASQNTIEYARDFMRIILAGNVFTHLYIGLNNIIRSSGHPTKAMLITLATVLCNLILAPIFIFYFHWGIKGAASATIISQIIGTIWVITHFINKKNIVYFRKRYLNIKWSITGKIFSMGMSSFLINFCACIIVTVMNKRLQQYGGDYAIGAYGIINSIVGFLIMIVFGFNLGMQPIVGFNYGAKQYDRVLKTLKLSLLIGTCITSIGFFICECFPWWLARCFNDDKDLLDMTVKGMRIIALSYPIVGGQVVASNFFQAVGKPKIAIFLSLSRQVLFLLPALFVLPHYFQLQGVWFASPCADIAAALVTFIVLTYNYNLLKKQKNNIC